MSIVFLKTAGFVASYSLYIYFKAYSDQIESVRRSGRMYNNVQIQVFYFAILPKTIHFTYFTYLSLMLGQKVATVLHLSTDNELFLKGTTFLKMKKGRTERCFLWFYPIKELPTTKKPDSLSKS